MVSSLNSRAMIRLQPWLRSRRSNVDPFAILGDAPAFDSTSDSRSRALCCPPFPPPPSFEMRVIIDQGGSDGPSSSFVPFPTVQHVAASLNCRHHLAFFPRAKLTIPSRSRVDVLLPVAVSIEIQQPASPPSTTTRRLPSFNLSSVHETSCVITVTCRCGFWDNYLDTVEIPHCPASIRTSHDLFTQIYENSPPSSRIGFCNDLEHHGSPIDYT